MEKINKGKKPQQQTNEWVALVANSIHGRFFCSLFPRKLKWQNSTLHFSPHPPHLFFFPHHTQNWDENPKAQKPMGKVNSQRMLSEHKTCCLSSAEAAQPRQHSKAFLVLPPGEREKLTLLHHLVLVSSNKPGQTACQQHPDQLFQTRQTQDRI